MCTCFVIEKRYVSKQSNKKYGEIQSQSRFYDNWKETIIQKRWINLQTNYQIFHRIIMENRMWIH